MDDGALFRTVEPGGGLLAMPVYSALLSLPPGLLFGGTLAANARPDAQDVWELFARLGFPRSLAQDQWGAGFTAGYSRPAESVDGELSLWKSLGPLRLLAEVRGHSDLDDRGARAVLLGGAVIPVAPGRIPIALAGDVGGVLGGDEGPGVVWSVGLHAGIAFTPFTVAFQASNARDPGFQGSAVRGGRVHFGVAVMSPVPLGRWLGWTGPREGGRSPPGASEPTRGTARFSISRFAYWPARIEVAAGTVVEWVNEDAAVHTVTADDGSFTSGSIGQGERWQARFDEAGTYYYQCASHAFMRAVVIVRE